MIYSIEQDILNHDHFISTINSASFLSGTGITLNSISHNGIDSHDLTFSSSLNNSQLDSLSIEIENYTTPTIIVDNYVVTSDIGICDKTTFTTTKQFLYNGTDYTSTFSHLSFWAYRVSGTGNFHFRLWNNTTVTSLAESLNMSNSVMQQYIVPITSLPVSNSLLDLQCYVDDILTMAQFSNVELVNL